VEIVTVPLTGADLADELMLSVTALLLLFIGEELGVSTAVFTAFLLLGVLLLPAGLLSSWSGL
jgi:hypothetical protein